jgi:hypothetical protein
MAAMLNPHEEFPFRLLDIKGFSMSLATFLDCPRPATFPGGSATFT